MTLNSQHFKRVPEKLDIYFPMSIITLYGCWTQMHLVLKLPYKLKELKKGKKSQKFSAKFANGKGLDARIAKGYSTGNFTTVYLLFVSDHRPMDD